MANDAFEEDITVWWQSDTGAQPTVEIVVIVPTFRRPEHLVKTLSSVIAQRDTCGRAFAIVVMDNDPANSAGARAAKPVLERSAIPATIVLANRRGNCAAYNAGIETALKFYRHANWLQIIDDDEVASQHWLQNMIEISETTGAEFVGAPQLPVFEDGGDPRWASHPVFTPPHEDTGEVPILYSSGNVMIRVDWLRQHENPWFDEMFNFLGGGDSDLYSRAKAKGARFAWCREAPVDETTSGRRTELSWLNSRSLRNGSISALIQQKSARNLADHTKRWIKSLLLLVASPYRSLILFVKTGSIVMALNPMNVALGRLLMEFGFANEQYRTADRN